MRLLQPGWLMADSAYRFLFLSIPRITCCTVSTNHTRMMAVEMESHEWFTPLLRSLCLSYI